MLQGHLLSIPMTKAPSPGGPCKPSMAEPVVTASLRLFPSSPVTAPAGPDPQGSKMFAK